jgi:eukaryotic-like serine/threonine-protein kinase
VIGETIGNFRVSERVGQGGMGEVYLAEQTTIGTKAAIKVMRPDVSSDQEYVQRFFNEARAVSRIQHAGIVRIFDVGRTPSGAAYLVMEFLEGETLQKRIARGRLGIVELCDFGKQIASVLGATHSAGITHRDLKPDNIYVVPDKELPRGERIKVLDFGIAKLTGTLASSSPATMGTMGTPAYMAPEQWGDSAKVDWRADVYSLGCVAFEMACGRPPFIVRTIAEACAMHLHEAPPSACELVPTLPPSLDHLLARLLAKAPEERPQSMQEIAQMFDAIGEGRGTAMVAVAGSPTRSTTALTQAGLAQTSLGPSPQIELPVQRRSRAPLITALAVLLLGAAAAAGYVIVSGQDDTKASTPTHAASGAPPVSDAAAASQPPGSGSVAVSTPPVVPSPPTPDAAVANAPADAAPAVATTAPKHEPPPKAPAIDHKKVGEVLHAHDHDYQHCYAGAMAHATEPDAKLPVTFFIEADGFPSHIDVKGSDDNGNQCVAGVIEKLTFPKTGSRAEISDVIEVKKEASVAPPAKELPETLDQEQLKQTIGRMRGAVLGCGRRLNASGRVHVVLNIAPDGSVRDAKVGSVYSGTPVGDCVLGEVKRQRFPASKEGMSNVDRSFALRLGRSEHDTVEP